MRTIVRGRPPQRRPASFVEFLNETADAFKHWATVATVFTGIVTCTGSGKFAADKRHDTAPEIAFPCGITTTREKIFGFVAMTGVITSEAEERRRFQAFHVPVESTTVPLWGYLTGERWRHRVHRIVLYLKKVEGRC